MTAPTTGILAGLYIIAQCEDCFQPGAAFSNTSSMKEALENITNRGWQVGQIYFVR